MELTGNRKYTYILKNLPQIYFTIGLSITADAPGEFEHVPSNAYVKIMLIDSNDQIVIQEEANLSEWYWGSARGSREYFFARRGQEQTASLKTGKGWGTSFIPYKTKEYHLTIEVANATASEFQYPVRLQVKGGGWK